MSTHTRSIPLILAALRLLSAPAELRTSDPDPVLKAPESLILDQGRVLLPERATALARDLQAAARERSIWMYVVTVPSLHVPPSQQSQRMAELAHSFADRWLKDRVGVIILFDDESSVETIVPSLEAHRQFPSLKLVLAMSAPLQETRRGLLTRDKMEKSVRVVLDEITRLQERRNEATRRHRLIDSAMIAIAVGGATLVFLAEWAEARRRQPRDPPA